MTKKIDANKRVTCQMIADIAHVSRATVRRVMRNEPYVKEEVRQRVTKIIEEYNYKPNSVGLALLSQRADIKIGVISFSATDALYEELQKGSRQAALDYNEYGVEILMRFVDDQGGYQSVIQAIRELIESGIRGLAITGIDVPEVREELLSIQSQIPIVTYNTEITGINELCFVGQDSIKGGRTAAALMISILSGEGDIAVVVNSMNVLAVAKRVEGFRLKLEMCSQLKVCETLENHSSNTLSYELLNELLKRNPRIRGIYIASGFGSKGVCQALENADRTDVRVIAHDLLPYTVENLRAGKIVFSIDQELFRQGYLPVEILTKYIVIKEKPLTNRIYTKIDIKTAENL